MFVYQINGTRFNDDEVRIDFRALDEYGQINLSGYVPVSMAEFFQHSGSMDSLSELVKVKVTERLENTGEVSAE